MTKALLRSKYKTLRNSLTSSHIEDKSLAIANQLLNLDIWDKSFYHLFLTIEEQKEVNTEYIMNILNGKDKNIVVSKSNFANNSMIHYLLTDSTKLKKNNYNIPEPVDGIEVKNQQLEIVFVPLLAFDESGNRIGYGKGFYDRFLSQCNPKTLKIGLSFFNPEKTIEVSQNDIKMDYVVTPDLIYHFQ